MKSDNWIFLGLIVIFIVHMILLFKAFQWIVQIFFKYDGINYNF